MLLWYDMLRNMVEKHSNIETQLQCTRANNFRAAQYWQLEAIYCGGWSGTSLPCRCFHIQAVGSLAQIDQFVGLVFWSQINCLEPDSACEMSAGMSRQMLLGKSSVSADYSVEDPAGSLQYEIPWNVTWISAEISWVGIIIIQRMFFFAHFFENG